MQGYNGGYIHSSYAVPNNPPWNAPGVRPGAYRPPHHGPAPPNVNVPFPMSRSQHSTAPVIPPPPVAPTSTQQQYTARPRRLSDRSISETPKEPFKPPNPVKMPKSALKKPAQQTQPGTPGSANGPPIARTRTRSDPAQPPVNPRPHPPPPINSSRSRETPRKHWTPCQIFVSFHASNRLKIDSIIYQVTVDKIREKVLPIWPQGIENQVFIKERNEFRVQFNGRPWAEQGTLGLMAMKLILELFSVLGGQIHTSVPRDECYLCQATINSTEANEPPRLVFGLETKLPQRMNFFAICFTDKRRKFKLINALAPIAVGLAEAVKQAFPGQVALASWQDEFYRIEMRKTDFDQIADFLAAEILEYLGDFNFKLEAGIPLPQSDSSGAMGRKEIWVFRERPLTN